MAQAQDEALCLVGRPKQFIPSRAMSFVTPLMSGTPSPGTCAPSFPTTRPTSTSSDFLPSETNPCADPQEVSLGYLAELTIFTGHEPKDLAGNEDLRVKPLVFHRPRKA